MLTAVTVVIGLHIGTYHFDRDRHYEEFNIGVSATLGDNTAGIYRNSEGRASVYGARIWRAHKHLDVAFGLVTGYQRAPLVPLVVPSVKLGDHLRLSLLLPAEKGSGGIHFSWEL